MIMEWKKNLINLFKLLRGNLQDKYIWKTIIVSWFFVDFYFSFESSGKKSITAFRDLKTEVKNRDKKMFSQETTKKESNKLCLYY